MHDPLGIWTLKLRRDSDPRPPRCGALAAAVDDIETHATISVWDLEDETSYEVEFSASLVKPSPISAVVR